jgi:hypothetical protein
MDAATPVPAEKVAKGVDTGMGSFEDRGVRSL